MLASDVCVVCTCLSDNLLQPLVLQQAESAEMDRSGEAAEKAAGQVWTGTHCLFWSGVLHPQCHSTATRDHKVMFDGLCKPLTLLFEVHV